MNVRLLDTKVECIYEIASIGYDCKICNDFIKSVCDLYTPTIPDPQLNQKYECEW